MALSTQLEAILDESSVPGHFKNWMSSSGILSMKDFVLAARSDRAFVDAELIDPSQLGLALQAKIPKGITRGAY